MWAVDEEEALLPLQNISDGLSNSIPTCFGFSQRATGRELPSRKYV